MYNPNSPPSLPPEISTPNSFYFSNPSSANNSPSSIFSSLSQGLQLKPDSLTI